MPDSPEQASRRRYVHEIQIGNHMQLDVNIHGVECRIEGDENRGFWQSVEKGEYKPDTFRLLGKLLKPGDTLLDVGSWVGPFSLYAAGLGATVHSVDPDPVAHGRLEKTLILNPELRSRIHLHRMALGPKRSGPTMYARKEYGNGDTSLLQRIGDRRATLHAECRTLEDFLNLVGINKVDVIRMDISGGEFELLETIPKTMRELGWPDLILTYNISQLNSYFYRQRATTGLMARPMMMLERLFGVSRFARKLEVPAWKSFTTFGAYTYMYSIAGDDLEFGEFVHDPLSIGDRTYYCTNTEWVKEQEPAEAV